jgi:hypothetical protein
MPGEDYGIKITFGGLLDIIEGERRRLNACKH